MSTGRRVQIPKGFKIKDGKLVKAPAYADVSAKLRAKGSQKVRVTKKGTP
jgi:hypothetical protein